MPVFDVYGERREHEVMFDTWGHLAPVPRVKYYGKVLIMHDRMGCYSIIDYDFGELPGSPWFSEDMSEHFLRLEYEEGAIHQFDGYYMKYKNGNYIFSGKWKIIFRF